MTPVWLKASILKVREFLSEGLFYLFGKKIMSVVEIDERRRKELKAEAEKLAKDDAVGRAKRRNQF